MTSYKFGCLPNDPSKPRVRLEARPGANLNPPASVDWYSAVPASSWGMLGNDTAGDCTVASIGHVIDQVEWYAQSHTPASVTTNDAIAFYSAMTGYDPATGDNDNGATLQEALDYWAANGLAHYKPTGYAQIDYTNVPLVQTCVDLFGAVYAALEVPKSAMQQFEAGQPWEPVARSPIEGGHAVPIIGYNSSNFYVLTWGKVQPVSYSFYAKYFEEAWAVVVPQMMQVSGKTPSGLDTATANTDFQELTGSSESPFPVAPTPTPNPTPTPTPTPTPGPDTDPNDVAMAAQMRTWLVAKGL